MDISKQGVYSLAWLAAVAWRHPSCAGGRRGPRQAARSSSSHYL